MLMAKHHRTSNAYLVTALAVLGLLAAFCSAHYGSGSAEAALGAPDLAIAIDVNGGGDDCDTRASTGSIGTTCNVSVGNMFTVRGHVDKVAGLPNTGGYLVFQFQFLYTNPGLTRNNRTGSGEVGPDAGPGAPTFWGPDVPCSPNGETDGAGSYYVDCWSTTKSMYTGKLVEVDLTCATAGMRTITMQDAGTYLHNDVHGSTPPDVDGDEILTINCTAGAAVGGLTELTDATGAAPLAAEEASSSLSIALMAGLAALGAAGLGGGALLVVRRRRS